MIVGVRLEVTGICMIRCDACGQMCKITRLRLQQRARELCGEKEPLKFTIYLLESCAHQDGVCLKTVPIYCIYLVPSRTSFEILRTDL